MTGRPQRDIFFVSNSVDELGGVTSWSHQMARLFTERGHRVHVIGVTEPAVPQELGEVPYPTTTLYDAHPPHVGPPRGLRGRLDVAERRLRAERVAGMRERAAELTALFRAARPGAVVIVTQVWAMEWVELADTNGLTVIGMSHESFAYARTTSRFRRVLKHYKDVDRMLALTREDADLWIRQGMNNASFMPNPLPFVPEVPSPRTGNVVVSVGRLHDQKGIDMLLDAWAETAPRHPEWRLRIYGSGEDEEILKKQCTALGLDGSVDWMGRTSDVPGALRGGSVFVLSSRGEGFPLALMEAMAAGLPCAAFDCAPGVHEIVRDGEDGLLATLGNTGELARRLDTLMSDKALRDAMGEAARVNVQRFTTEEIVRKWEELFAFLER
ncbi:MULTISPECIES: glycosyltransferase [unclassified Streptomyces]|uniref:glycosyltransferase n=1 Tax=unclassified Streptomyces TaxID=2593676 RepID=UPI0022552378|nr:MULTISPECIES: glycosyltransferase [unclassified Streptomyces]MCX4990530.1 glycosyltransferase [Streptomyces sp. NBC_00568]MCX5004239.1 glycosyltransferase [Streptomyces sp. NBC_00638]